MSGAEKREVIDRDVSVATFVEQGDGYYSDVFERVQKGTLPRTHMNVWGLLVPWLWSAWRGVWLMFWISLAIDVLALVCLMQVVKFSPLLAEAMLDPEANKTLIARYSGWISTYSWCAAVLFVGGRLWMGSNANRWYFSQYARWRIDDIVPSGTVMKRLVLGLVIIAIVAPITTYRATQLRLDERACFNQIRAAESAELLLTQYDVSDIADLQSAVRADAAAAQTRFDELDALSDRTAEQNTERSAARSEARDLNRSADLVDELVGGPVADTILGEIRGAFLLLQPAEVHDHEAAMERVLAAGEQDAVGVELDNLGLVLAAVVGALGHGVVGVIAVFVEDELAEAGPCLAVVIGDRGMDRVAVGEDILAAVSLLPLDLRERRGVGPKEEEAPVFEALDGGHRDGAPEA